ncbi:putative Laccase-2 [Coleophoma crateriformis]|uniref:laccase n=1 Tax=Coleophoma crateriformis TaxID=565419 RepID=A0A3D8RCG9_9HELO|nr:putative Laccase-2 [Coleophoma crateriformis]
MKATFVVLAALASQAYAALIPSQAHSQVHQKKSLTSELKPRASCDNTATSRDCWGDYSIDTNWYTTTPTTGVTREYWLSVENVTVAPDGYERYAMTFNGTVPGPTLIADWGDELVIHVTNNMKNNGTAIHWHGLRQKGTLEMDGVPGVTQCPIAPGESFTYSFQATQYGTTWYHSHFSLQYGDGLLGPLIINGPATADYDEDLGVMSLSDWGHESAFALWDTAKQGGPPSLENGIINGTNTYDCSGSTDAKCLGTGTKNVNVFESGKKYRLRLVNTAIDGHFQFSIDGHSLTVIAADLVPIVPYETDSILISIGQRYDVIVEANATSGDYWLRAGWTAACSTNLNANDITAIIRYDASSTADPTTTSTVTVSDSCSDEPVTNLVPYLAMDVSDITSTNEETLDFTFSDYFLWTINSSSLYLDWENPTTLRIYNSETIWPTDYNVLPVSGTDDDFTVYVIEDQTGLGLSHPIHLHGHDFWILAQEAATFDAATVTYNTVNPPRRDVATLPANGYLAIAFKTDNPGSWLMHCHIAWHASEGLAMQFVERESEIASLMAESTAFENTCASWITYNVTEAFPQDDSGMRTSRDAALK